MVELWLRPWALARRDRRCPFPSEKGVVSADNRGALWIYIPNNTALQIDNSAGGAELVVGFSLDGEPRRLLQLPAPLSRTKGTKIKCGLDDATLLWPHIPDRPLTHEPQSPEEKASHFLLLHARAVWDRLRDVDTALADPANLWEELRRAKRVLLRALSTNWIVFRVVFCDVRISISQFPGSKRLTVVRWPG